MRQMSLLAFVVACRASESAPLPADMSTVGKPPAVAALATAPCADDAEVAPPAHDQLSLTRVTFADLPGWADDRHGEAVVAFLRSCEKLAELGDDDPVGYDGHGGQARSWRHACAAARKLKPNDHAAAKAMFEAEFVPFAAAGKRGVEGKLTGYNVTEIHASRKRDGKYRFPVLGRPKDLVMIDLSKFENDSHGRRIWGRIDPSGDLVPFYTRQEIRQGAIDGRGLEIMYVDDPVDLLFAHIEGSAKAKMDVGPDVWLEFSGKNGRAYRGVGGVLKRMGALAAPGSRTMQGIRAWFDAHPTRFNEVADQVQSYVFFAESPRPGAVGSQKVILTPERSMAIDRAFIAQSTPIWVETRTPIPGQNSAGPWTHLLIAQDTGAGIVGAVRGDIYWGDDSVAAERGGKMGGLGKYWLLLPKGVTK